MPVSGWFFSLLFSLVSLVWLDLPLLSNHIGEMVEVNHFNCDLQKWVCADVLDVITAIFPGSCTERKENVDIVLIEAVNAFEASLCSVDVMRCVDYK